jgi:hypothetical protein
MVSNEDSKCESKVRGEERRGDEMTCLFCDFIRDAKVMEGD